MAASIPFLWKRPAVHALQYLDRKYPAVRSRAPRARRSGSSISAIFFVGTFEVGSFVIRSASGSVLALQAFVMHLPSANHALLVDHTGSLEVLAPKLTASRWKKRVPAAVIGMWGYLVAGVLLGLVLIATLTYARSTSAAAPNAVNAVTDTVTRLDASKLEASCFQGIRPDASERLTVSLEVGIDGKVRYASAAGSQPKLRSCVAAHVKGWEFLPQAQPQTMVLPFEVSRR